MDAKLILSVDFVAKVILFLGDVMGKTNERKEEISHKAKNRHKPQPLSGLRLNAVFTGIESLFHFHFCTGLFELSLQCISFVFTHAFLQRFGS